MRLFLLCVLALPLQANAAPSAVTPPALAAANAEEKATRLPLRARLDKDVIRAALKDLPAEPAPDGRRFGAATPSPTPGKQFATDFANARLPDCLHADGLKHQPTFFLGGVLALPFIAVAKLRGVCH
ncbi:MULTISPECIES: hypothetical protein [unclassified Massilia]|uniref:hypothetical protein n=1 Tax=unclassified Massilia TaxID=2609279 RepID=UPI0017805EBA|nr:MULTISPECIES: hypothetical protein [unclassified Massilia]MBD8530236.1 hypothetical protein [Massilia sp. CFBP 13647]MBD8673013.1 hypothetical protein [Massilia sp. CFBP 13721]